MCVRVRSGTDREVGHKTFFQSKPTQKNSDTEVFDLIKQALYDSAIQNLIVYNSC